MKAYQEFVKEKIEAAAAGKKIKKEARKLAPLARNLDK